MSRKVRTVKEYDDPHPFANRVAALDMFIESDLLFGPGRGFRYSTPGFVLLGAVIERAGEGSYVDQVVARICKPLGMTKMRPDYTWEEIPHRAAPYQTCEQFPSPRGSSSTGTLRQTFDEISWKLPAGGWISTAGDMGRFAAGLMGTELLAPKFRDMMWTMHTDYGNGVKGYGLGISLGKWDGRRVLMHGGGQVGASTYLLCSPDTGHAVAILTNTEGVSLSDLAFGLLDLLLSD